MKPSPISYASLGLLAASLVLAATLAGCEEDVTVSLGTDHAYSLYGFLNPQADTQWIRVYPIEGELLPFSPDPLDAHFTSLEMETGAVREWHDSIVAFPEGGKAHVFWSPFRAGYERTYRLEVERSDGAVASVEARTPKAVQAVQLEPEITYSGPNTALAAKVVLPVHVDGSAPRVLNVQAEYTLLTDVVSVPPSGFENVYHRISIPYMSHVKEEGGNWRVDIDLRRDYVTMRDSLTELHVWRPSFGAYVALLTLRMDVVNEEWNPPGGAFDPDILVQPGSFSNVVNGFGFVGAGFQLRHTLLVNDEWDPLEQEAERAAGFNPCPC